MRSHLLEGVVRHRRARPFVYALEHGVWYAAFDLAELASRQGFPRLLARNGPGVVAFRDEDHFVPPAADLQASVLAHLRGEGIDPAGWTVTLITNVRVVGYVFNPASFYLCRDASGALALVVVEVHNTHHERHLYTLRQAGQAERGADTLRAGMDKAFYVSPFIDLTGQYEVHVRDEPGRLRITINESRDGELVLHASLDLVRRPLSTRTLLRLLLRYPLVTHKTMLMIHWHALRLWRRGARFQRHRAVAR
jgi:uncharacterized protein